MRLTVMVDNNTNKRNLKAEAGLSFYIEDGATKILFDTGESALFIENAAKIGLNLGQLDYIVLSHGHFDHSGGLKSLLSLYTTSGQASRSKPIFLAHPLVFSRRVRDNLELGCEVAEAELENVFSVHKSNASVWITENLVFLGEIDRNLKFEGNKPIGQIFQNGCAVPDYICDDTALAFKSEQGLVIITGCSHSGICNIVEQAKQVCKDDRILAIIGGFHLKTAFQEQLKGTISYLKQAQVNKLYAGHCTDQLSKIALAELGNLGEVFVGLSLEYE